MNLLFIGGTRLLGKRIVELFLVNGKYDITIISRKANIFFGSCEVIAEDRSDALKKMNGRHFDFVFDFIAYDVGAVKEVISQVSFSRYIFISSCWMTKLNSAVSLDDFVTAVNVSELEILPEVTKKYLLNKQQAELFVRDHIGVDRFTILRLPVFFGEDDHTKRLEFYVTRFLDGNPVMIVNGGKNICQPAFVEDLAHRIERLFMRTTFNGYSILEGVPSQNPSVYDLLKLIKECIGSSSALVDVSQDNLQSKLPEYLEKEPLWREKYMQPTTANLFLLLDEPDTSLEIWIAKAIASIRPATKTSLREQELALLNKSMNGIHSR